MSMPINERGVIDFAKLAQTKAEKQALKGALAFSFKGANDFRPAPGQMIGLHELQVRMLKAIEAGEAEYTDPIDTLARLMSMIAGVLGYTAGLAPNINFATLWRIADQAAVQSYSACLNAAQEAKAEVEAQALAKTKGEDKPAEPTGAL